MKKINENTKVTLTLGQLKRLVGESRPWYAPAPSSWYDPPEEEYSWDDSDERAWLKPFTELMKTDFTVEDVLAALKAKVNDDDWPPQGPDDFEDSNEDVIETVKDAIEFCEDALKKGLNKDEDTLDELMAYMDDYIPAAMPKTVSDLEADERYRQEQAEKDYYDSLSLD